MTGDKDKDILRLLNNDLKQYKIKLSFQYYDVCPFDENKLEIMGIILKYAELFESYYNKIYILSSLCDECFKGSIPYLVNIYQHFVEKIYNNPKDEMFLLHICDTISKINALEYQELYKSILCRPITSSAGSIIEMLDKYNVEALEDVIFSLIKKENLIPRAWIGELNEEDKYWCSFVALKYVVNRKNKDYLSFFQELFNDENFEWINFSDSKYKEKLTLKCKNKYKKLASEGIKKLRNCKE